MINTNKTKTNKQIKPFIINTAMIRLARNHQSSSECLSLQEQIQKSEEVMAFITSFIQLLTSHNPYSRQQLDTLKLVIQNWHLQNLKIFNHFHSQSTITHKNPSFLVKQEVAIIIQQVGAYLKHLVSEFQDPNLKVYFHKYSNAVSKLGWSRSAPSKETVGCQTLFYEQNQQSKHDIPFDSPIKYEGFSVGLNSSPRKNAPRQIDENNSIQLYKLRDAFQKLKQENNQNLETISRMQDYHQELKQKILKQQIQIEVKDQENSSLLQKIEEIQSTLEDQQNIMKKNTCVPTNKEKMEIVRQNLDLAQFELTKIEMEDKAKEKEVELEQNFFRSVGGRSKGEQNLHENSSKRIATGFTSLPNIPLMGKRSQWGENSHHLRMLMIQALTIQQFLEQQASKIDD